MEDDLNKPNKTPPAPAAAAKTVEDWATARGYLPEMLPVKAQVGRLAATTERPNPKLHCFAMAKALRGWPVGAEVTEEEFDKAVDEAGKLTLA